MEVVDVIASIVSNVSTALGYTVHFRHGHIIEINNVISKIRQGDSSKVWPMIALLHDFKQDEEYNGTKCRFKLLIVTRSSDKYIAEDRKEKTFKTVLVPIYNELKKQIIASKYVVDKPSEIKWPRVDHYFYGTPTVMGSDSNIFDDWIDCIELENLELTISIPCEDQVTYPSILEAFTGATGEYIYLKMSEKMELPEFPEEIFTTDFDNNGAPLAFDSLVQGGTDTMYILKCEANIPAGADICLISQNDWYSVSGVKMLPVLCYPVVNNVQ